MQRCTEDEIRAAGHRPKLVEEKFTPTNNGNGAGPQAEICPNCKGTGWVGGKRLTDNVVMGGKGCDKCGPGYHIIGSGKLRHC